MSTFSDAFLASYHAFGLADQRIAVAVSGGVDSMTLLSLLLQFHKKENIIVLHFDHMLRGDESDQDRIFVENFCRENMISFRTKKENIRLKSEQTKQSLEMTGRDSRSAFFLEVCHEDDIHQLLTAHHLDDRIETALFHLIRGTKLDGIHALSATNSLGDIAIIRPLLPFSKTEIRDFARENAIPFREDSTNTDIHFQRNYLRHDILPKFQQINPEYRSAIGNFISYTEELSDFINLQISSWLDRFPSDTFAVSDFRRETLFFQREIIRFLYQRENHGTIGLSEKNIAEILRFITTSSGGTEKKIHALHLRKQKNIITTARES